MKLHRPLASLLALGLLSAAVQATTRPGRGPLPWYDLPRGDVAAFALVEIESFGLLQAGRRARVLQSWKRRSLPETLALSQRLGEELREGGVYLAAIMRSEPGELSPFPIPRPVHATERAWISAELDRCAAVVAMDDPQARADAWLKGVVEAQASAPRSLQELLWFSKLTPDPWGNEPMKVAEVLAERMLKRTELPIHDELHAALLRQVALEPSAGMPALVSVLETSPALRLNLLEAYARDVRFSDAEDLLLDGLERAAKAGGSSDERALIGEVRARLLRADSADSDTAWRANGPGFLRPVPKRAEPPQSRR